jgi:hypothetical protein
MPASVVRDASDIDDRHAPRSRPRQRLFRVVRPLKDIPLDGGIVPKRLERAPVSNKTNRPSPLRAGLGAFLALGSILFLVRMFLNRAVGQTAQGVGGYWGAHHRDGIADRPWLNYAIGFATVIVGVLLLKGVRRLDRPSTGIGFLAGAMVAFSLFGGVLPGIAEFVYEGDSTRLRFALTLDAIQAGWYLLAAIAAYAWLHISERRAHKRRLAGLNHPSDGL